jgi:hypothetical protein
MAASINRPDATSMMFARRIRPFTAPCLGKERLTLRIYLALPHHLVVLAAKTWRRWQDGGLAPFCADA